MIEIHNEYYVAEVLDPVYDEKHLGRRYTHGASLWMLKDVNTGQDLISGPRYPEPQPPVFHGQGFPEVFRENDKDSGDLLFTHGDGMVLIPGVGVAEQTDEGLELVESLMWSIEQPDDSSVMMETTHRLGPWAYGLCRSWRLVGTALISETRFTNNGDQIMAPEWYAHPFFAPMSLDTRIQLQGAYTVPSHENFRIDEDGAIAIKNTFKTTEGDDSFAWLYPGELFSAEIHYEDVTWRVLLDSPWPMSRLAIWGNKHTVSLEPYMKMTIDPGESLTWSMVYDRVVH